MNKILGIFRSHPYISNVLGYTALFASADLIQQGMLGEGLSSSTQLRSEDASEHQASFKSGGTGPGTETGGSLGSQRDSECRTDVPDDKDSLETFRNVPGKNIDWSQTARIALIGLCFHSNFNYHWLRALEKTFPGGGMRRISLKVCLDQLIAAPATISAFYIGENIINTATSNTS